jgi:hypothetical protein
MKETADYFFEPVSKTDMDTIHRLALTNDGNERLDKDFFTWWYEANPSGSFTFLKLVYNGSTEGYATTNNFTFCIEGINRNVAMPQNVLTSSNVRGGGFFGKLYRETESNNRSKGFDTFLTFTNKMSTPIFTQKFKYVKGNCPDTYIFPNTVLGALGKKDYVRLGNAGEIDLENAVSFQNSLVKNREHYIWRYANYSPEKLHIIRISKDGQQLGYAIMKSEVKKGLRFLLLMDIITLSREHLTHIVNTCKNYTFRNGFFFLLFLELDGFKSSGLSLRLKNRFNFLVKGRDEADTLHLSQLKFNLFFGDMDIV